MPRKIALIACVSKKLTTPKLAKDLYVSDLFTKASTYGARNSDQWYILSAKYGLLAPNTIIEPYDATLNTMPVTQRRAWAQHVLAKLLPLVQPGDYILILAGTRYREYLVHPLEQAGCIVDIPMEGLRIGEQLRWLGERI